MDTLQDYLQNEYRDHKRELDHLDRLLAEVWPIFPGTLVAEGWPYEVRNGHKPVPLTDNYSYSTNAMILFAMAVALGWAEPSALVPRIQPADLKKGEKKEFRERFETSLQSGLKVLTERATAAKLQTTSGSFGENDPMTYAWLASLVAGAGTARGEGMKKQFADYGAFARELADQSLEIIRRLERRPSKVLIFKKRFNQPADHAFPVLRILQLYRVLQQLVPNTNPVNDELERLQSKLQGRIRARTINRVHEHISLSGIAHANFDPGELVFSLESVLLIDGDPRQVDPHLVNRVFAIMRQCQQGSPYWRPLKPFVTTRTGFGLLPLSVEIASSLLRSCQLLVREDDGDRVMPAAERNPFSANVDLFRQYADWLYTRVTHVDVAVGGPEGKHLAGWHSEHVQMPRSIHTWETAQVAVFLMQYRAMLQEHIARTALDRANLRVTRPKRAANPKKQALSPVDYWTDEWQKKGESLAGTNPHSPHRSLSEIGTGFLAPRDGDGGTGARAGASYSMLLYGPPGTAKSSAAEEIAKSLKWTYIIVTPSDFVAGGEAEVEARAKAIFETLQEQRAAVILFDEIDRMILDREAKLYREQGDIFQFLTPGMLVKLNDLRKKEQSVFIIATNYEDRIDPAAKRTGRIDARLLLAPPDKVQRGNILRELAKESLQSTTVIPVDLELFLNEVDGARTPEFDKLLKSTVLTTFGELKELFLRAVRHFKDRDPHDRTSNNLVADLALEWERQEQPAIRLGSYKNRFWIDGDRKDFPTAQEPFLEFFILIYLMAEVGGHLGVKDASLVRDVAWRLIEEEPLHESESKGRGWDEERQNRLKDELRRTLKKDDKVFEAVWKLVEPVTKPVAPGGTA